VAKKLSGLVLSEPPVVAGGLTAGAELLTADGKNAGKITSITFSPKLESEIALGFVRYDYLAEGTELLSGDSQVSVKTLPF
jgi:glycine cleavage system aminomethyltransferase T